MNLKEVAAYIYRKPVKEIKWAKREGNSIHGRFADGIFFKIVGKVDMNGQ